MTRKLETTIDQVQAACEASIPGWAETSFILDAGAAHELLGLVRELHAALKDWGIGCDVHCDQELLDRAAPWLSDPE